MLNTILGFLAGLLIGGVVCSTGVATPGVEQNRASHAEGVHRADRDAVHLSTQDVCGIRSRLG